MMKDNQVISILDYLKKLRDIGATVIFLHHQPKQPSNQKEKSKTYKVSTTFADSLVFLMVSFLRALKAMIIIKNL